MFEYLLLLVFAADMVVTFYVAVYEGEKLVTGLHDIRQHYLAGRFWLDLLTTIPIDLLVMAACGLEQSTDPRARYISMLGLLKLVSRPQAGAGPAQQ